MFLRRLNLKNYGGIFNGMGLYEIDIDFTKCKNRLILIKGDNGTGKSTIEMALKPLPDDSTAFIAGKTGYKLIEYFDETNGIIYSIQFIHECSTNGTRKTKGYISKTVNGETIELNPSGNITGCRDIIYDELQLDPNYITLCQLSNTKRGIADMKPADRKRYINSIISNTEVYNEIHKTLSKKSSNYKALMNSITSKLSTIGNLAQVEQNIKTLREQIECAENNIKKYTEIKNKEEGMLQSIDPNLQSKIETYMNELNKYTQRKRELEREMSKLSQYSSMCTSEEFVMNSLSNTINEINTISGKMSALLETRQVDADQLTAKSEKLKSINSDGTLSEVKKVKNELHARLNEIETRWGEIINLNSASKDEFISLCETINTIEKELMGLTTLYSEMDINNSIYTLESRKEDIEAEIDDIIDKQNFIDSVEDKLSILESRPKDCVNDNCPFIADALKSKAKVDKLEKSVHSLEELNKMKQAVQSELDNVNLNKNVLHIYNANTRLFMKYLRVKSYDECIELFRNGIKTELRNLTTLIQYADDIDEYRTIEKHILEIEAKYNNLSSQEDFINMLMNDIEELNQKLNDDQIKIQTSKANLEKLEAHKEALTRCTEYITYRKELDECNEAIQFLNDSIQEHKQDIQKINDLHSDIDKITREVSECEEQLKPMRKDLSEQEYKLTLSKAYTQEFADYKQMFDKIEVLKYYSSSTTGIQLVFANMYLSKILNNANNILKNLFSGKFALLPLIVSESEFRIPVAVDGGINHDDITSMSSAQISLISMIISISLLSQTSTKLNIIVGDEIDAPFDSENRREFINILYQLMGLVNSTQCVLISHNSEIDLTNCDVILLRSENDTITNGNIIWSYNK